MPRKVEMDKSASGSTMQLAKGDQLHLTLPETRTAGFRWQVTSPATSVFNVEDDGFAAASAVGGTGQHRWTLTAMQPGSATFAMGYGRSWEASSSAQPFTLTVKVSG